MTQNNDLGAVCLPGCGGDCSTCKERPFGSSPCPQKSDNGSDEECCMGNDVCENGEACFDVLKREWPLAEIAITMSKTERAS